MRFNKKRVGILLNLLVEWERPEICEIFLEACKSTFLCDFDFIYHKLINCHRDNPDKVEELYQRILKEDFEPSNILLRDIAEILEEHNRPVPFTLEESDISNKNDLVYRAIDVGDKTKAYEIILDSFDDDSTTLKCKVDFIKKMMKYNHLDYAANIASLLANNFPDPEKIRFKGVYYELIAQLSSNRRDEFLKSLNKSFRKILQARSKSSKISTQFSDSSQELEMHDAYQDRDYDKVETMIRSGSVSVKSQQDVLSRALESDNLPLASRLVLAITADDDTDSLSYTTKDLILKLFKKYKETGQVDQLKSVVNSLGPKMNLLLRGYIWVKASMIRCDPDGYLETLYTEQDNSRKWLVNTEMLTEAVEAHPDLVEKLTSAAERGLTPAAVLLAKLSLARHNLAMYDQYLPRVPDSLLRNKRAGLFDMIDTSDVMIHAINTSRRCNHDDEVIANIANCCLATNKDSDSETFAEIGNKALELGVSLDKIAKSLIVKLSRSPSFIQRQEARKMINDKFVVTE